MITGDAQDFSFYDVDTVDGDTLILPAQRSNIAIDYVVGAPNVVFGASLPTVGSNTAILIPLTSGALAQMGLGLAIAGYLMF
jgi:hypothetical protein